MKEGLALVVLFTLSILCAISGVAARTQSDAPSQDPLKLYLFKNASTYQAQCNDGTPAGFYFRPGNSSKWSIHLAGGFWCWDEATCLDRAKNAIDLTSSKNWKPSMTAGGVLSSVQSENPDFYDATSVFVGYCSSDAFSGDNEVMLGDSRWLFKGRRILVRLLSVLITEFGLSSAKDILFSGCSAGGQAVVANVDFVGDLLKSVISPNINFKGLADAGWMMNIQPRNGDVSVEKQFRESIVLWRGKPNQDCVAGNLGNEWMCFISPYAHPYIQTPLLVQTQQYDQFQVSWDCCTPPFKQQDIPFVNDIRKAFSISLSDIIKAPSSAFSSACWQHCLSEDSNLFRGITIQGVSLQEHLGDWFYERTPVRNLVDHCVGFQCSKGCPSS